MSSAQHKKRTQIWSGQKPLQGWTRRIAEFSLRLALKGLSFFVFTMGALLAVSANADPTTIVVSEEMKIINQTASLTQLPDPDNKFDFEQVIKGEPSLSFNPIKGSSVHLRDRPSWFKATLENPTPHEITIFLEFDISSHIKLGVYTEDYSQRAPFLESGWKMKFRQRSIPFLHPTLELLIPPGKTNLVMRSEGRIFSFSLGSKSEVTKVANVFETVLSLCLATFMALGLYNFFIYTRTGDRAFLYYFLRCVVISVLTGTGPNYAAKYLFSDWSYNFQTIPPWISSINSVVWLLISRKFLSMDNFLPKKLVIGAIGFLSIGLMLGAAHQFVRHSGDAVFLITVFNPLSMIWNIGVGVYICFKSYRPAYFFLPATTIYFVGVAIMLAMVAGVFPSGPYIYLAPSVAGAIEAILMSLGLGDKYMSSMKAANATLNQKNEEMGRDLAFMLHSLKQGIFSVGSNGEVSREHSAYLKTIFGKSEVGGLDAFDLLFDESGLSVDRIDQIKNATLATLGEGLMTFEMNEHIFPRDVVRRIGTQQRVLEIDWQPLMNKFQTCEKMMVVLRDVTALKDLEQESEKNQEDLQIVGQILSVSIRTYEKFSQNASSLIAENIEMISSQASSMKLDLGSIFRNIHTIKGNARTFGLIAIANAAHKVEDYYSDIRLGKVLCADAQRMVADLDFLKAVLTRYDTVLVNFLQVVLKDNSEDLVFRLNVLHQQYSNSKDVMETFYEIAEQERIRRFFPKLEDILSPIVRNQRKIAGELSKTTPSVIFKCDEIHLSSEVATLLQSIFTQLFRNSIDHGIEYPDARSQEGKAKEDTILIEIQTSVTPSHLVIEIQDDGAGLDIKALAKKCGNPFLSDQEIAETIFHTGVSTAATITQTSGRGVGMDIVKALVVKQGGTIAIAFTKPKTATGRRPFKFVLTFPSSFLLVEYQKASNVAGL